MRIHTPINMLGDPVRRPVLPRGQLDVGHLENQLRCWAQLSEGAITMTARRWLQDRAVANGLDRGDADAAIEHVLDARTQAARQRRYEASLLVKL